MSGGDRLDRGAAQRPSCRKIVHAQETAKLQAETNKFVAKAAKLSWNRWFAPVLATASLVVAIGTAISVYLRH